MDLSFSEVLYWRLTIALFELIPFSVRAISGEHVPCVD
jgi:hypothetical protein